NTKSAIKNLNIEDIYSIAFINNVVLSIDEKLNIFSNRAVFEKNQNNSNVFLYPKEQDLCLFKYENNEITAKEARLDLESFNLFLKEPKGTIKNMLKKENTVSFRSDELFWHNFENAFLLSGHVNVIDPEFGIINSDEVEIIKKIKQNQLRKIISRKNTTINFFSKNQTSLKTKGIIELDHEKKCISAFSSKNPKKSPSYQDEDLVYKDLNVTIRAKRATLKYTDKNDVEKIILENSVRFIYQNQGYIGYGIADKIEYFPNEKNIKLISEDDKKVLFWKEDNSLNLSANEIHINQKEKNDIKGLGDVRFTFNLDEENLIHDIFSKYVSSE
nr:hypothetical protein [Candidatus Anoxychlamydiales bacterium]